MEMKVEAEVKISKLPGGLFAVGEVICRSWAGAVQALEVALGIQKRPRKADK